MERDEVKVCVYMWGEGVERVESGMGGWMDGWMSGWLDGWMGGWMGSWCRVVWRESEEGSDVGDEDVCNAKGESDDCGMAVGKDVEGGDEGGCGEDGSSEEGGKEEFHGEAGAPAGDWLGRSTRSAHPGEDGGVVWLTSLEPDGCDGGEGAPGGRCEPGERGADGLEPCEEGEGGSGGEGAGGGGAERAGEERDDGQVAQQEQGSPCREVGGEAREGRGSMARGCRHKDRREEDPREGNKWVRGKRLAKLGGVGTPCRGEDVEHNGHTQAHRKLGRGEWKSGERGGGGRVGEGGRVRTGCMLRAAEM